MNPGDVLLYSGSSPLSWAIKSKTWSDVSHAELFVGFASEIPTLMAEGWGPNTRVTVTARLNPRTKKIWRWLTRQAGLLSDGVDYYMFDPKGLRYILRPEQPWTREPALARFEADLRKKPYDTLGLLTSFYGRRFFRNDQKAFCSETTRLVSEWGGVVAFAADYAPDATAPATFLVSPSYRRIVGGA